MVPVDLTTGKPCGSDTVEVVEGYLATHSDGTKARLAPDKARADLYAVTHHATIEPMYVRRVNQPSV